MRILIKKCIKCAKSYEGYANSKRCLPCRSTKNKKITLKVITRNRPYMSEIVQIKVEKMVENAGVTLEK